MEQLIRIYFTDYMHAQHLMAISGVDLIKVEGQIFRRDPQLIKDIFDDGITW